MIAPTLPGHWRRCRLKNIARINPTVLAEDTDPDLEIRYVDIGNVGSDGRIHDVDIMRFGDAPSRARRPVSHGDVIVATVRTYLRAIAHVDQQGLVVSTGFAVLRPNDSIRPRFLWRMAQSEAFVNNVVSHSEGISYPAINPSELASLPTWLPPLREQDAICDYVDRKIAKVDALIAKKRQLLDLLREWDSAVIAHMVSPGSPVSRQKITDWLDEIPSNWTVVRHKAFWSEVDDRSQDGDETLLTVSHLTGVTRREDKSVSMFMAENQEGYKRCLPGDLVINTMWAWMGALGIAWEEGIVSPSYNVYRPQAQSTIDPRFFDLLCRSKGYVTEINRRSKGVWHSRLRLYPEAFLGMPMPLPPFEEQTHIAHNVNEALRESRELAKTLDASVALLREQRAGLITAAVTGQIDASKASSDA